MGRLFVGIFLFLMIATIAWECIKSDILFFNICGWCVIVAVVIMFIAFIIQLLS